MVVFFDAYAPHVFDVGGAIAGGSGLVAVVVAIAMSVWRSRQSRLVTTYGSARWATDEEIKHAGLTQAAGVFLGRMLGRPVTTCGTSAPSTSSRLPYAHRQGISMVIPTLLSWLSSVVIHDIKGENWKLTAGWRSLFSHCLLFNPTDPASAAYNPLLEVRRGVHEVRDVQNIADILVDPEVRWRSATIGRRPAMHCWSARSCMCSMQAKTRAARRRQLPIRPGLPLRANAAPDDDDEALGRYTAPGCRIRRAGSAEQVGQRAVGRAVHRHVVLGLYRDPTVAAVTSRCDWRIADLISAKRPVSLYLVVPPSDISRTKPLVRLILNQIGRRLTESLDGSDGIERKRELLLMLDEFPHSAGWISLRRRSPLAAGYGIRSFLIAQSLNQIDKAYGPNNSILDNCHVRVAYATNDERTAKRISEMLGTATELRAQRNYAGHRLAPGSGISWCRVKRWLDRC